MKPRSSRMPKAVVLVEVGDVVVDCSVGSEGLLRREQPRHVGVPVSLLLLDRECGVVLHVQRDRYA
jgi:hypothetical protein